MNKPTKKQIKEARDLGDAFGLDCGRWWQFSAKELALLIAHVRTEATNAALERAALRCHENMMWHRCGLGEPDDYAQGKSNGAGECAEEIRAMRVKV